MNINNDNPLDLIRSTIQNFEIEPDLTTLDRINENLLLLKNKKLDNIDEQKNLLKNLSLEYDDLNIEIEMLKNSENKNQIKQEIFKLNNLNFKIAKNLNNFEINLNLLRLNLENLKKRKIELDNKELKILEDDSIENFNSILLKLKLFKKMGIIMHFDKKIIDIDENSQDLEISNLENDKVIIYNKEEDATNVLNIDDKYSTYFISNYIWERV
ncbi:hypothetical protein PACTADRAFT_635 [Pachysolen tannophilus NRRL Y-2460]|uniref:Kinetochore protein Spc24 n=1 Tax=Pachysolen tannophilus NRRL Y-2460 TaxID=669874 RepID=A0A1E4U2D1_PACTA|nr:hypothetical protein PACTADRAFT_635 [Pachysolen tannophilus NRRL Y-2460]